MQNLFLETIKIKEGNACNLSYHQARFANTLLAHFPNATVPNLSEYLHTTPYKGIHKCRILYTDQIQAITYEPYTPKRISSFTLVECDIDYTFKYADRSHINALKKDISTDEIIILKEGLITDTSYSNLAFYDGSQWFTPRLALLKGTMRNRLIKHGKLVEADISTNDLSRFGAMAIMNAMIGFKRISRARIYDHKGALCYQSKH